jgi:hypothetical protein
MALAASVATRPRSGAGAPVWTTWHPTADQARRKAGSGGRGELSSEGAGSDRKSPTGAAADTSAGGRAGASEETLSAVASTSGNARTGLSIG